MKFLEAARILKNFEGGEPLSFLLATSGEVRPLEIFLAAAAAERSRSADVRTLPFNTLSQKTREDPRRDEIEVFLLFPWDLLPGADWRSGFPTEDEPYETLVAMASENVALLRRRPCARFLYVDSPIPTLLTDHRASLGVREQLRALAVALGAEILPESVVSLGALFEHGLALAPAALGDVARRVVHLALHRQVDSAKVLVTDFDGTLWHGVVGEVGVAGLSFSSSGLGFPHFIYQTYLRKLRRSGVLLAGVTRNDPDLALAPLQTQESVLKPDDFVAIIASYSAKSAQIAELARQLNLGLDSFVFVDDNPVEIAEVSGALPAVRVVRFPSVESLPELLSTLSDAFHRETVTAEDADRTEMYRRRLAGMAPTDAHGSDLTAFLASLDMRLTIHDRTTGDRARAVQLINKTNQFNLNGVRRPDDEVGEILSRGGRLYTAKLSDRHGEHGEILALLIDADHVVRSFVMSCRVFERRVEHAFLAWLSERQPGRIRLEFEETERNEPIRRFMRDASFAKDGELWSCDLSDFSSRYRDTLSLFRLEHDS